MSIRFREPGEPRRDRVSILTIPPERRIRFLGGENDHIQVYVHWIGPHSVPCLGEECELCETPPTLFGYAAVAHYVKPRTGGYIQVPAILPVTENALSVLEADHRNLIFMVSRHNDLKNGRLIMKMCETVTDATLPLFDVKEKMIALWLTRDRTPAGKEPKVVRRNILY